MGKTTTLKPREEQFCRLYVSSKYRGNGVRCVGELWDYNLNIKKQYHLAGQRASEVLKKPEVKARIRQLLEAKGFNDEFVDLQLLGIISQSEERHVQLGGIREYNKLMSRVTEKLELSGGLASDNLTPEEREAKVKAEIEQVLNNKK